MKDKKEQFNKGEVIIYSSKDGEVEIKVKIGVDTIWLTQEQIALLFGTQRPAITKHLGNIFKEGELDKKAVSSILEHTAPDGKKYKTNFYNLDAIISVGYRVNSQKATQFRIWATSILKKYLLDGYAVNEQTLLEAREKFKNLQQTISFLQNKAKAKVLKGQEKEILNLLSEYSRTLTLLEKYDKSNLQEIKGTKSKFTLEYSTCLEIINKLKINLINKKEAGNIFGLEINNKLESIVKNLYQTYGGRELYKNIEDKASHLLYLIIKDHPFSDGNKRTGAFLFVYFLDKNNYLYRKSGEKKINDNALTALALLVAESNPKEKDQMVALISQLLR
jgi:prophage maintenance system killer protein